MTGVLEVNSLTTGKVFEDLGFTREESAHLALKVFLGEQVRIFIRRNRLSQARAAARLGVQQPKISKILNENLDGMSIEYLVKLVARTGGTLEYSFTPPKKNRRRKDNSQTSAT
ncbi:XRE family transcriptional regulator [Marinihelvus fidelis]|uniref:XRE family transcriptional regulator n=1 Tax=Marinihelvus fidelis TaxID=2613842 RepID=A0A5N0T6V9_9GAMM|nr:helix-turn-helix transcriptional regulator [Marinihelvus fidelis]KAA9130531.1 XRE family transcriptional regulator [Marinihelvus fidelis]